LTARQHRVISANLGTSVGVSAVVAADGNAAGYVHVGEAVHPLRSIELSSRYAHDGVKVFRGVDRPPQASKAPQQLVLRFDAPALGSGPAPMRHTLVGTVLASLVRALLVSSTEGPG